MLPAYILAVFLVGMPDKPPILQKAFGVQHERQCHIERAELQKKLDSEPELRKRGALATCLVVTIGEQV